MEFKEWLLTEEEDAIFILEGVKDEFGAYLQNPSSENENRLFDAIREIVFKYSQRHPRMQRYADDIAQQTALKILPHVRDGKVNLDTVSTWVISVATNVTNDMYRRIVSQKKRLNNYRNKNDDFLSKDTNSPGRFGRVGSPIMQKKKPYLNFDPDELRPLIEQLPEPYRSLLIQYYFKEKKIAQLADEAGLGLSNAKRMLVIARNMLKNAVQQAQANQ